MSAWNLYSYSQHLKENRQKALRYEIALWMKVMYPLAVLVMMVLALPFAYFQKRQGGVGARIFTGIMLGIAFYMMNRLFARARPALRLARAVRGGHADAALPRRSRSR